MEQRNGGGVRVYLRIVGICAGWLRPCGVLLSAVAVHVRRHFSWASPEIMLGVVPNASKWCHCSCSCSCC